MWVVAQLLESSHLFFSETSVVLIVKALVLLVIIKILAILHLLILSLLWNIDVIIFVSPFVSFGVSNHIYVALVDILEDSLTSHQSLADSSVDSHDLNSISWLDIVDKVLIGAHGESLWCLSLRDRFWGLLHLDVLLVTEHAEVVHHLESESSIAVLAVFWLSDFSALNVLAFFTLALGASEGGFLHLRGGV